MGNDRKTEDFGALAGTHGELFKPDEDADVLAAHAPFSTRQPRGGSRKGIPNKRNDKMRDVYLRLGLPHPMLKMGQVLQLSVEELAGWLDCAPLDALDLQRKVAADLMPYLESKMPTAITGKDGEALPVLIFGDAGEARRGITQARAEGALSIDDDTATAIEQYQRVKDE